MTLFEEGQWLTMEEKISIPHVNLIPLQCHRYLIDCLDSYFYKYNNIIFYIIQTYISLGSYCILLLKCTNSLSTWLLVNNSLFLHKLSGGYLITVNYDDKVNYIFNSQHKLNYVTSHTIPTQAPDKNVRTAQWLSKLVYQDLAK